MSLVREISRAIRSTLVLWILTAIIYPFVMLAFGQIVFPFQANGSLLKNAQGEVVGSALIGQPFTSDRYFNSRPSAINYSTVNPQQDETGVLKTGISGASNLAPSNPALLARIKPEIERLQQAQISPNADLIYSSGSGLDPHITVESARSQIPRIAKIRGLDKNQLELLITKNTEGRFLGIFGEPVVNVLQLNLALDQAKPDYN